MTVCRPDMTPMTWHKIGFNSAYLVVVGNYIKEKDINAQISGAISYGVMGPAPSKVSFENKDDFDAFVKWFDSSDEKPISGAIFVSDSNHYTKTFPASEVPEGRGSHVTELPKGDDLSRGWDEFCQELGVFFTEKNAIPKDKIIFSNNNGSWLRTKEALAGSHNSSLFPVEHQNGEENTDRKTGTTPQVFEAQDRKRLLRSCVALNCLNWWLGL